MMAWLQELLVSLAAVLIIRQWLWMPVVVKGSSMRSTLENGQVLWTSRIRLRLTGVKRGDIVICHYPGRTWKYSKRIKPYFVKRVIGVPGDRIRIEKGVVYINNKPLDEPYLDPARNRFPRRMEERRLGIRDYFVMGDNRDNSNDSRRIGPIRRNMIVSRVNAVLWPRKAWKRLRRRI